MHLSTIGLILCSLGGTQPIALYDVAGHIALKVAHPREDRFILLSPGTGTGVVFSEDGDPIKLDFDGKSFAFSLPRADRPSSIREFDLVEQSFKPSWKEVDAVLGYRELKAMGVSIRFDGKARKAWLMPSHGSKSKSITLDDSQGFPVLAGEVDGATRRYILSGRLHDSYDWSTILQNDSRFVWHKQANFGAKFYFTVALASQIPDVAKGLHLDGSLALSYFGESEVVLDLQQGQLSIQNTDKNRQLEFALEQIIGCRLRGRLGELYIDSSITNPDLKGLEGCKIEFLDGGKSVRDLIMRKDGKTIYSDGLVEAFIDLARRGKQFWVAREGMGRWANQSSEFSESRLVR